MLQGPDPDHFEEAPGTSVEDLGGLPQGGAERRVEHVRRGEPVVEPGSVLRHAIGQHVDEGGQIVMDLGLPGPPGGGVDRSGGPCFPSRSGGNRTEGLPTLEREGLDLLPPIQLGPLTPHGGHLGEGVALDHERLRVASRSGPTETIVIGTPAISSTRAM